MAFWDKLFGSARQRDQLKPLYDAIVTRAREPTWYREGGVPDTQDGRFDMIAAVLALVLLRLEDKDKAYATESALLAEVFIEDMDGQLREIGVGDVVVGKHIGKIMGALGGRMTAYRESFTGDGDAGAALLRNLYRGEAPEEKALEFTAHRLTALFDKLSAMATEDILAGELPSL